MLSEMESFLSGLSAMFMEKEIHAIHKFFDIDQDGTIQKQEFMGQLNKAENLRKHHFEKLRKA